MRITPDTNVLVRAAVQGSSAQDKRQSLQAHAHLRDATGIALTLPALCEFVWVLRSVYKYTRPEVETALRKLCSAASVQCDRQAVEAGLDVLARGGDFADGVIASTGAMMGSDLFLSFDRKAVQILQQTGHPTRLLSSTRMPDQP